MTLELVYWVMRKIFYLCLLAFTLFSCEEGENPANTERYVYTNSEISAPSEDVGMYVNWTAGNKTVFRYIYTHPEEENIADDELSEIFWIEIPSNISEFSKNHLTDSEVEVYYTRSCFCYFEAFEFEEFSVSGTKKNNGTWELSFSMKAKSPSYNEFYELEDSGVYTPSQMN